MKTVLCLLFVASSAMGQGFVINEDDSHFFVYRAPEEMSMAGLNAFVDQYAGTKVSHLFLCPNAMKASYRSAVRDAIWDIDGQNIDKGDGSGRQWVSNAKLLFDRGLDPYAVWIARCREKGISPWLSMRMNDVHNVDDPTCYIHDHFWVKHPDYWRVPGSKGNWVDRALDYGIPEVREHNMALVRELLERYDADGLELDWMRFGYHFAPGKEKEGAEILTTFTREVRKLTKEWAAKRGHPIKLGARVPTLPDAAIGLGMDAVTWVREGLIDMLVPTPFWATTDFDIPIETWRERIGPSVKNIVLAAGGEVLLRAYPSAPLAGVDLPSTRGFAAAHLHRGADQIYLFNYMDKEPMLGPAGTYQKLLHEGLSLDVAAKNPRRHVVTFRDTVAPGMSNDAVLPVDALKGGAFRIYIGPAPKQGKMTFVAGLTARDEVDKAACEVFLNDAPCKPMADGPDPKLYPTVARALQFECPLASAKEGYNNVRISQKPGQAGQQIVWAELRIEP
ncbi:MAG: family 10 glycosylhydrolase [Candidatus Hydrogenedentes bacterium]|nr:family 10 glycosylhydrolase [Candidatus Hydrogenedentota bacterium]